MQPKVIEFDKAVSDEIVAMRSDGKKWDEISQAVEMPPGKCMLIHSHATCPKKDRIKDATGADVVRLRDEERLSWGDISARTGYSESSLRGMYEAETSTTTKGNRIGKGGRHPGANANAEPRKPRAASKKAAAGGGKAAAKGNLPAGWDDMDPDAVTAAVTHRALKVLNGDTEEVVKVKAVKKVTAKTINLVNEEGKARTIKRDAVVAVSKGKVIKS